MKRIVRSRGFTLLLIIAMLCAAVSIMSPNFLTVNNFMNIIRSNIVLAVCALGLTVLVITGNVDVSTGAQLAVISVAVGNLALLEWTNMPILIAAAIMLGVVLNLLNAVLCIYTKLSAIIITMGSTSIFRGAIQLITNGSWVSGIPAKVTNIWVKIGEIPLPFFIFTVLLLGLWFVLSRTRFGRSLFAVGGNRVAAKRMGFNENKVMLGAFTCSGVFMGIASFLMLGLNASAQPSSNTGYEMTIVSAVILGGANINGGRASVFYTTLGVLLIGIINNGMVLAGIDVYFQTLVHGLIIVAAITSDALRAMKERNTPKIEIREAKKEGGKV